MHPVVFKLGLGLGLLLLSRPVLADEPLSFNQDIRPILSDNCFACHGPDSKTREADLRLDDEESSKQDRGGWAVVLAGKPDESELIARITSSDRSLQMPPPQSGKALTDVEIQTLRKWIREGAPYQKHWSFEPIRRPETDGNAIDELIEQQLKAHELERSPPADPTTQLRRVSLDLTGIPPTIQEVDEFIRDAHENGVDVAYENAVQRLLQSPRYGEHMAWTWLEAARFADTDGYQNDGPREMWRWRDWVIDAFNNNMPFDQFTIEQLAGDQLSNPTLDQLIATGFNRNHRYNSESGIPIDEFLLENAVDRVDTTATVWLGLTIGCARCHDHKYDPISQSEYYQLIDYFNDVAESGRAIKFGNSEPWIKAPTSQQQEQLDSLAAKITAAKEAIKDVEWEEALTNAMQTSEFDWQQPIIRNGLDHYWSFDEGQENFQIIGGDAQEPVTGVHGNAVSLSADHHLKLDPIPGLIGNGRFSISFWCKPASDGSGAIISSEAKDTKRAGMLVEVVEGRLRWNIIFRWVAGVQAVETKVPLTPNEWVHVTLTNDGTQRTAGMQIYLNGIQQEVIETHNTNSNRVGRQSKSPVHLGFSHHVGSWQGQLDELRFYTERTLSSLEAKLLAVEEDANSLVAKPADERSEIEKEYLRRFYFEKATNERHRQLWSELLAAEAALVAFEDRLPTTMVMKDLPQGRSSFVRNRGVYDQLGDQVKANVPDVFGSPLNSPVDNRLALANWLTNSSNPLTARVTANRIWQSFFGRGIVKTTGDFGSQGSPPTHPELLDWLASELIDSGWDYQHLVYLIAMSDTYRQSSAVQKFHLEIDPENHLLARSPILPLPGNLLRDQALAVSGVLVEKTGGPSVKPYQPNGLWKEASNFTYQVSKGEDLYRRSLYTYWKRTLAPPTMALLDTGDREYCTVQPKRTNTPLQALTLLNDVTFVEAARCFAERLLSQEVPSDLERLEIAFRSVTCRHPCEAELKVLERALNEYRIEFASDSASANRLIQVGQAPTNKALDPIELAAWTSLANILLNLDEVTSRQ